MNLNRNIFFHLLLIGFIPIKSFGQNNLDRTWLVGTWRTCQDTAFSVKHKCTSYLNTYILKPDGTYLEPTSFAKGKYPYHGTWILKEDTLTLKDSTVYEGVFSSFSVNVYKIKIVNKNFFYSKAKSELEYRGHFIYDYFIKQE